MRTVLILRPEPGGSDTAARARAHGLEPVLAPLFAVRALDWGAPTAGDFDALMLTSANAARYAGAALTGYTALPCYAVGASTAAAASAAGFSRIIEGRSDGAEILDLMASHGVRRAFHPSGRERKDYSHQSVQVTHRAVYAAEAVPALPGAAATALTEGAVTLVHSPRAGAALSRLVDAAGLPRGHTRLAAISPAAAEAAGEGWARKEAASRATDEALLELAVKLCKTGGSGGTGMSG